MKASKPLACVEATHKAEECLAEIEMLAAVDTAQEFRKHLKALGNAFNGLASLREEARTELYKVRVRLPYYKPPIAGYNEWGVFAVDIAVLAAKKTIRHAVASHPDDCVTPESLGLFTGLMKYWATASDHKRVLSHLDSDKSEAINILGCDRQSKGFGGVRQTAQSFGVIVAEVRRRAQSGEWPSWVIGGKRVFDLDEIATIEARQPKGEGAG
jgi:hypothetical protein